MPFPLTKKKKRKEKGFFRCIKAYSLAKAIVPKEKKQNKDKINGNFVL